MTDVYTEIDENPALMHYVQCNFCEYTKLCVGAKGQCINRIFYCEPFISYICLCFQTLRPLWVMDFIRVLLLKIQPSNALALLKLNRILKVTTVFTSATNIFLSSETFACPKLCTHYNINSFTLAALSKFYSHINFLNLYFTIFLHVSYLLSTGLYTTYHIIPAHYHLYILTHII